MQDAEHWPEHARLVMAQLNEKQRRWSAGLLSEAIGWGGDTRMSRLTGLDPKTIKRGREELATDLEDCPAHRIRREGGGRLCAEKKIPCSKLD